MKRLCTVLLVGLLCFAGCTEARLRVVEGQELQASEQQSLYEQMQHATPDQGMSVKVYWTPSGTRYHKDAACSYLKNSKNVMSGTLDVAINQGADLPCSRCAGG